MNTNSTHRKGAGGMKLALMLILAGVLLVGMTVLPAYADPATNDTVIDPDAKGSITLHKYLLNGTYTNYRNDGTEDDSHVPTDADPLGAVDDVTSSGGVYDPVVFYVQKLVPWESGDPTSDIVFESKGVQYKLDPAATAAAINGLNGGRGIKLETDEDTGEATTGNNSLPVGIYLVTEQKPPKVARPADPFLVSIPTTIQGGTDDSSTSNVDESKDYLLYDVHAYPKNEDIGITKQVGTGVDTDTSTNGLQENLTMERGADYAEPVNWYIESDLPPQIADNASNYTVIDTYGAGLQYIRGSVEVYVDSADFTAHQAETGYTALYPTTTGKVVLDPDTDYYVYPSAPVSGGGGKVWIVLTDTGRAKLGYNGPDVSSSYIGDDDGDASIGTALDGSGNPIEDFNFYTKLHIKLSTLVLDSAALNTPLKNGSKLEFVNDTSYEGTPADYPDQPPGTPGNEKPDVHPEDPSNPEDDDPTPPSEPPYPDTPEFPTTDYPDGPPPTERESEEPYVYTGGFHIIKKDAADQTTVLSGAAFKLVRVSDATVESWSGTPAFDYDKYQDDVAAAKAANATILVTDSAVDSEFEQRLMNGTYQDYTVVTDADGKADFKGLSYGKQDAANPGQDYKTADPTYYYLVEVDAPAGYSLPSVNTTPIVKVDYDSYTDSTTSSLATPTTVLNTKSFLFPFTGGSGSVWFIIIGMAVVGAGIILLARSRRRKESSRA